MEAFEKKLLTCVPTRGQVWWGTAQALHGANPLYIHSPRGVCEARNSCRAVALDRGSDILLMVDDDVMPSADIFTEGLQGILHGVAEIVIFPCPIVQGRASVVMPNLYDLDSSLDEQVPKMRLHVPKGEPDPYGYIDVAAGGFGCVAISRNALELIGPFAETRNERGQVIQSEDIDYCLRAQRLSLRVKAASDYFCDHAVQVHAGSLALGMATLMEKLQEDHA